MHPSTEHILRFLKYDHRLPENLQELSMGVAKLAHIMVAQLPEGPELTTGLRKLLEAKDCFVRAKLDAREEP